jgi:hypothetical protein
VTTSKTISDSLIEKIREFHSIEVTPRDIFRNYILGNGTWLTRQGFALIKPILDLHHIIIPKEFNYHTVRSKVLLSRAMKYPFFVEKGSIWLSSAEDAFLITLYSGDIELWASSNGIS